jgi:hypothetical protein
VQPFLLEHYAGDPARLRSDVMKVCHHGSRNVTDEFIQAIDAATFVVSSGDEEGHVHPRPDLLGRLGKLGRGDAPVILSTELQRSVREREDRRLVDRLKRNVSTLASQPSQALLDTITKDIETLGGTNVSVSGSIYVKTDGARLIAAFKIEAGTSLEKWFWFEYRVEPSGALARVD